MSDNKVVLDETIDTYPSAKQESQPQAASPFSGGGLLGGMDFDDESDDEVESVVEEEYLQSGDLYGNQVPHSVQEEVQEEPLDLDLDIDVSGGEQSVQQESTDGLRDLFQQQEALNAAEEALTAPVSDVSVKSELPFSRDGSDVSSQQSGSEQSEQTDPSDLGNVPENLVKPIKVIDVVRKGLNASNKGSKRGGGRSVGSSKKNAATGGLEGQTSVKTCHVKGIPRILMDLITMDFKAGSPKNQTDALVAWIVCHCEEDKILQIAPTLTSEQIALIESWENTPNAAIQEKLDKVTNRLQNIAFAVDTLKLLTAYNAFDRAGFRNETPSSPRGFNFNEAGVCDVVMRAEEQTSQMRNDRTMQKGRPIR